jgi:hypothetical protein
MKEIVEQLAPVMIIAIFAAFWCFIFWLDNRTCRNSSTRSELPPLPSFSSIPKYTYTTTTWNSNQDLSEDQLKAIQEILKQNK